MVDTKVDGNPTNLIISKSGNIANQKGGNPNPVIPDEMKTYCKDRGDIPASSKVSGKDQGTMSGATSAL